MVKDSGSKSFSFISAKLWNSLPTCLTEIDKFYRFNLANKVIFKKHGIPGNGNFSSKDRLYTVLTSIIFTCSVSHASTNFPQYDEYAFPPNYPAVLTGTPPKDKTPLEKNHILKMLPDKPTTIDMMIVTKILSQRGTRSLGDFEVQYIFEPEGRKVVDEFRADLAECRKTIKEKNKNRNPQYTVLDPDSVPNSISI